MTKQMRSLTWAQITEQIMTQPTVNIWVAGRALGYRSRTSSFDAAQKGYIKTIPQGRLRPVPTSWLRGVLGWKDGRRNRRRVA